MRSTAVRDVMTSDVVTVGPDTSFRSIVNLLAAQRIDAVPVVDAAGAPMGVVSHRDLTCHEERPPAWTQHLLGGREVRTRSRKARARTAGELMTSPARTVAPDAAVCEALGEMGRHRVGRLLVVDRGRLVGILTRSDVLRCYQRDDDDVQRDVERALRAAGVPADAVVARVTDGVVALEGRVERLTAAWAAADAARGVPGVVDVDDAVAFEVDDSEVALLARGPFA